MLQSSKIHVPILYSAYYFSIPLLAMFALFAIRHSKPKPCHFFFELTASGVDAVMMDVPNKLSCAVALAHMGNSKTLFLLE